MSCIYSCPPYLRAVSSNHFSLNSNNLTQLLAIERLYLNLYPLLSVPTCVMSQFLSLKDGAIWSVSLSDKVQIFVQLLFCLARLDGRLNVNSCFFFFFIKNCSVL